MARIDMWLDDDDIKEGKSSGRFLFTPPSDAVVRGNLADPKDDKAKASWVQHLKVENSSMYEDTTKDKDGVEYDCVTVEVEFKVPPDAIRSDGEADPNAGRSARVWYRIVPEAMKNKQHPKHKANNFNHGKAMQIVRSAWGSDAFPIGQRYNLADYFGSDEGETPSIVGMKVVANIKQSKYDGEPKDEFTDFVPLELQDNA